MRFNDDPFRLDADVLAWVRRRRRTRFRCLVPEVAEDSDDDDPYADALGFEAAWVEPEHD